MICPECIFCEVVVKEGDQFTFINPHGESVHRNHDRTVYICRANPPITGDWPQVSENDWCGQFQKEEDGSSKTT